MYVLYKCKTVKKKETNADGNQKALKELIPPPNFFTFVILIIESLSEFHENTLGDSQSY